MKLYPIPSDFIYSITSLSWCDIKWGYKFNLITSAVPIKKAEEKVLTGIYNATELNLSFLSADCYDISLLLNELCPLYEKGDESKIEAKWLFITLSWLWINRNNVDEPLAYVESIYADFSYPSEIESFVRYMPTTDGYDPLAYTKEENINRMLDNWRGYLDRGALKF